MFQKEDNTFNELREKTVMRWLEEMTTHEDLTIKDGSKVTLAYIESLKHEIGKLERQSALKDFYLKKAKENK